MNISGIKRRLRKDNPRWVVLLIDLIIVGICYYLSNFIINSFNGTFDYHQMLLKTPFILAIYFMCFILMKTFKGIVRQAGISDTIRIFKTVWLACMILIAFTFIFRTSFNDNHTSADYFRLSFGVIFVHAITVMVSMVAARVFYRSIYESLFLSKRKIRYVLIFGASRPALVAFSLLKEDQRFKNHVVAFVADKENRVGKRLAGVKVMSLKEVTTEFSHKNHIEEVIIAVENHDPERLANITDHFQELKLDIKIMPPARLILNSGAKREIRPLKIEDLLGRKDIKLDNPIIEEAMTNKVILITGAAGSIGGELSRQIARRKYKKLILLDQAESALYDLQQSIKVFNKEELYCIVGDVRDHAFLDQIFLRFKPDYVFHAAAYKHVPLMEANPYEAIYTNIVGSKNVADLSIRHQVEKFVMVSTDKAVNPTNVMGATKRAAEIYVSSCNAEGATNFIITRFGNVLGSNGSVIPLFEKQMAAGGPLTLTHPDITRFFMTIPEACQLVQEAGIMGHGGEIFVFDMGKSVKIIDLAKRMIRLKGFRYPEDIDIKIVGLRPGEKIFEELLATDENTLKTHHPKIMIAQVNHDDLLQKIQYIRLLEEMIYSRQIISMELVRLLKCIVPEYKSQNSEYEVLDHSLDIKNIS